MIVIIVAGVLVLAAVATLLILRFKFGFFTKKKAREEVAEGETTSTEETHEEATEQTPASEADITSDLSEVETNTTEE